MKEAIIAKRLSSSDASSWSSSVTEKRAETESARIPIASDSPSATTPRMTGSRSQRRRERRCRRRLGRRREAGTPGRGVRSGCAWGAGRHHLSLSGFLSARGPRLSAVPRLSGAAVSPGLWVPRLFCTWPSPSVPRRLHHASARPARERRYRVMSGSARGDTASPIPARRASSRGGVGNPHRPLRRDARERRLGAVPLHRHRGRQPRRGWRDRAGRDRSRLSLRREDRGRAGTPGERHRCLRQPQPGACAGGRPARQRRSP